MVTYWDSLQNDDHAWDFSLWTPDIVVVNLGQNDYWLGRLVDVSEVGQYAVKLVWGDGHNTGLYSFGFLRALADACREEDIPTRTFPSTASAPTAAPYVASSGWRMSALVSGTTWTPRSPIPLMTRSAARARLIVGVRAGS